jgi:hypothetical protein
MTTFFDKYIKRYPNKSMRLFEIIPPSIAILLITLPFWGAILFPVQLAYFIIFFDIYWLYKSINLAINSFVAAKKIKNAERQDWLKKASELPHFEKVHHLLILPLYKEKVEKVAETLETIKNQTIDTKRLHVCLGMEARETEAREKSKELEERYKGVFGTMFTTFHPIVAGEVAGKSSNQAYAGRQAYELLVKKKKLDIDYLTVSSVDADTLFDEQYFAYLSYLFLKAEHPYLTFWQSANVNYNNFWKVPSFVRIVAFFGSLWRASMLVMGLRLIPNSTYSLSFNLIRNIGYWDVDVIPEDYRVFFKAFFMNQGNVYVEPIFLKTSMDIAQSTTYWKSLKNKFEQERRWSWGIADDAVYMRWWLTVKNVPFWRKTIVVSNVLMDHILWPVNWFIITISANVIVILNPAFSRTTLGYNLPRLSSFILTMCIVGMVVMLYVDYTMRSKKFPQAPLWKQALFLVELFLLPVAGFFISTLPALMSHIQLILGKRLEYKVTEKV